MAETGSQGIAGLMTQLSEQQLLRGTGAIGVGDGGRIFLVFGHPLHAVAGEAVGLAAVDVMGEYARRQPDSPVLWSPGVTAGRAHSLAPSDGVFDRLRRFESHPTSTRVEAEMAADRIEDLGLRRRLQEVEVEVEVEAEVAPIPVRGGATWEDEIAAICAAIEQALHRNSRALVEVIGRAEPEPRAILLAIERARGLMVRAVSPRRVGALLDAAEAEVRRRASGP